MNTVVLIGNVAHEGELKEVGDGKKVLDFRLAVPKAKKDAGADFITIEAWEGLADICSKYASKGREIAVTGRLTVDEWSTDEGEARSRVKVVARQVDLLRKPGGGEPTADEPKVAVAAGADDDDIPF